MINLKQLLQKISETISNLASWLMNNKKTADTLSTRGEYYQYASGDRVNTGIFPKSLEASTYTNIFEITIPPGRWLFYGQLWYASNANGRRYIFIGSNSEASNTWARSTNAVSGSTTRMNLIVMSDYTTTTTVYLVAYSSVAVNVSTAVFSATRLEEG